MHAKMSRIRNTDFKHLGTCEWGGVSVEKGKESSLCTSLISRCVKQTYFFFLGFCRVERSPLPRMRRSDCQREPANMENTIYTLFHLYIQLFTLSDSEKIFSLYRRLLECYIFFYSGAQLFFTY
jgi:hypothetical protein